MSEVVGTYQGSRELRHFQPHQDVVSCTDLVGIEIELENLPFMYHHNAAEEIKDYWDIDEDHSLRGPYPCELRHSIPVTGADLVNSLDVLEKTIDDFSFRPISNHRTSMHVHLDVRDLTQEQLVVLFAGYLATERLLFEYIGQGRYDNIYCIPWSKAEHNVWQLSPFTSPFPVMLQQMVDSGKYSALNINPVMSFGSIEFRLANAHWKKNEILPYVNMLLKLKQFAKTFEGDVLEIPNIASGVGVRQFVANIYGQQLADLLYYSGCETSILNGVRLAQDMMFYHKLKEVKELIKTRWLGESQEKVMLESGLYQINQINQILWAPSTNSVSVDELFEDDDEV